MRSVQVRFPSGREVLSSYWGFLHRGGLVLDGGHELHEGDEVELDVSVTSLKQRYRLRAQVVRREPERARTTFAFAVEASHDQSSMLNAAWADSHDAPQRKHRRYPTGTVVIYGGAGDAAKHEGRLLDVSSGGCRLKGPHVLPVGTRVRVRHSSAELEGHVRWSTPAREMGIEFTQLHGDVDALRMG